MADTCDVENCDLPIKYSLIKRTTSPDVENALAATTTSRYGVRDVHSGVVNLCKEHHRRKGDLAYMKNGKIIDTLLSTGIGWDNTWASAI